MRSTDGAGVGARGPDPGGVLVRRTRAGGGTVGSRRLSRTTCLPTAEIAAVASSVPSGDIEHVIMRYVPCSTGAFSFFPIARRFPTTRPRSPYVASIASTSPLPISASLLSANSSCSVGVATQPRNGGTAGPLTIVMNAGSRARVVLE